MRPSMAERVHAEVLRRRLRAIDSSDADAAAHRARIEVKRLRYLLEPVASWLDGGKPLVKRLKGLQELLGELHDLHMLDVTLETTLEEGALAHVHDMLAAQRRGDEQKLSDALHKIAAEDRCLLIEHNAAANETVMRGTSELHLRLVMEKMKSRYNVKVNTHPPSIPYRETITASAEGHHRHKKQTGGAGQFGEVYLRVEALPPKSGFEFANKVVGGAIPSQFIPAVEKGVRQVMQSGAIAGYAMQDIRVTVHDG